MESKCQFDFGVFTEECGTPTNIVGLKSIFNDKKDFLMTCYRDCSDYINEGEFTEDDVKEGQIRYMPSGIEGSPNGYYLTNKYTNGCSKVYYIDL